MYFQICHLEHAWIYKIVVNVNCILNEGEHEIWMKYRIQTNYPLKGFLNMGNKKKWIYYKKIKIRTH